MPNFIDSFTQLPVKVKEFFGGTTQQPEHETSPTNTSTLTHANSTQSHASRQVEEGEDGVEEVVTSTRLVTGKRARDVDVQEASTVKKRRQASDNERRLFPNYHTPQTATAIATPTYDGRNDTKTNMGGNYRNFNKFAPTNTLNEARHAPKGGRVDTPRPARLTNKTDSDLFEQNRALSKTQTQSQLSTVSSKGINVKGQAAQYDARRGEGFVESGPFAKKQKTSHSHAMTGYFSSDHVDLTSDDDKPRIETNGAMDVRDDEELAFAQVVLPGRSPAPSLQSTMQPPPMRGQREKSELMKANDMFKTGSKRKPKAGGRASQSSSQTPSVIDISDSNASQQEHPRRSSIEVVDDPRSRQAPAQATTTTKRRVLQGSVTDPPINLDKGVEEYVNRKVKPGSTADLKSAGNVLMNGANRRWKVEQARRPEPDPPPKPPRHTQPEMYSLQWYAQQGQQEDSQRLAKQFVRDAVPSEKPTRPKASQRMVADSQALPRRVSPIDDSLGSVDELAGGNTVDRETSRSISPAKKQIYGARSKSPSDILPTKFQQSRTSQKNQSGKAEADATSHDFGVMPIRALYSSSCVLATGGEFSLSYDGRANDVDVCKDGMVMAVPGKGRGVILSKNEVRKIYYNPDSNRAYVIGSATDVSNGHICIAFADFDSVRWFQDVMSVVTNDQAQFVPWELEKLNKTFAYQCHQLNLAYERAKTWANPRTHKGIRGVQGRRAGATAAEEEDDEEQIKYESDVPKRQSLRHSMLGNDRNGNGTDQRTSSSETRSRFFEPAATRRSTRERKQVQERMPSASPERWTKVNKLKPWAHPVVYPPQGARRVTAEFNDIERLDEGQFLNDNVISFALRKIEEEMAPEHKDSVHFFNTFFYTSLTTRNGKKGFNYDAVKKWTKNKDILATPYVVVPINIDLHWFVAIIANLDKLDRKPAGLDDDDDAKRGQDDATEELAQEEADDSVVVTGTRQSSEQPQAETEAMHKLSLSDEDKASPISAVFDNEDDGRVIKQATADVDEVAQLPDDRANRPGTATSKKGKKKSAPPLRKYDIDIPAVITLDSFGSQHTAETRMLKDYITNEAETKRNMKVERDELQGLTAKGIPQQTNFCDCGVYLIGYVEQFAKDPKAFVEKVLNRQLEQDKVFENFDPSKKRDEIRDQLLRLSEEQEAQRKEAKRAKAGAQTTPKPATDKVDESSARDSVAKSPLAETQVAKEASPKKTAPFEPQVAATQPPRNAHVAKNPAGLQAPEATAKATTKRPVSETDDVEDELETAIPRPLSRQTHKPATTITAATTTNIGKYRDQGSSESDIEESEMLDNDAGNEDSSRRAMVGSTDDVDPEASQPSAQGGDLLTGLDAKLQSDAAKLKEAASAKPTTKQRRSAQASASVYGRTSEKSSISLEQEHERPAEVADSQEALRAPSPRWQHPSFTGTRTTFAD